MKNQKFGRYPEIFLGLILIIAGVALVFVLSGSSGGSGREVAVLSSPIRKDEILSSEHLGSIRLDSSSSGGGALSPQAAERLAGQRALIDLPLGTPVLEAHFSSFRNIAPGQVLVGMRLGIGQYPLPSLAAGDLVDITVPEQSSSQSSGQPLLARTEVYSAYSLGSGLDADMFITLVIPEFAEQQITEALASDQIRLFLSPHAAAPSASSEAIQE